MLMLFALHASGIIGPVLSVCSRLLSLRCSVVPAAAASPSVSPNYPSFFTDRQTHNRPTDQPTCRPADPATGLCNGRDSGLLRDIATVLHNPAAGSGGYSAHHALVSPALHSSALQSPLPPRTAGRPYILPVRSARPPARPSTPPPLPAQPTHQPALGG